MHIYIHVKEEANFLNAITTYGSGDLDNIQSNVMTRSKNQIRNRLQKVLQYCIILYCTLCYTLCYNSMLHYC